MTTDSLINAFSMFIAPYRQMAVVECFANQIGRQVK